jgi:hypothetical protein
VVPGQLGERVGLAGAHGAEQVLRLVLELIQVGTDGQVTVGHDEPPLVLPGSAGVGQKEVRSNRVVLR